MQPTHTLPLSNTEFREHVKLSASVQQQDMASELFDDCMLRQASCSSSSSTIVGLHEQALFVNRSDPTCQCGR